MQKQARAVIKGKVQGVWFRAFTRDQAQAEQITGWVRNRPDGAVEAVFEGEEDAIVRVLEKCRQGPPSARVEDIETEWQEYGDEFSGFDIRQ